MRDSTARVHRFCVDNARRKDEGMPPIELRAAELGEPVATDRSNTAPAAVVPGNGLHSVASPGARRISRASDRIRPGTRLRQSEGPADLPLRDDEELEAVDRLLAGARRGAGGSLVLRGEPGTGKTTLLEYAVGQATGMHSVRVTGIESESRLGFAAAHQLLVPFLSHVDRLPSPQRDALRTVAGLVPAPTPEPFLIGLAMLTLLAEAARERPLLVTIDDAQWLDQTSAQLLGFVARRVQAYPIAVLAAVGEPAPHDGRFAGVTSLTAPWGGRTATPAVGAQAPCLITQWLAERGHHGAALPERRRVHAALAASAHWRPNANDQVLSGRSGSASSDHPEVREVPTPSLKSDALTAPGVLLRDGLAVRLTHGYQAAVSKLRVAINALLAEPAAANGDGCDLFAEAGTAAGDLLDDGTRYVLTTQWVGAERDRGDAGRLPEALSCLARVDLLAGWMESAEAYLAEARSVAAVSATPVAAGVVSLGELTVLAWQGRAEEARSAAARLRQSSVGVDPGTAAAAVQSALAVLELASGRYQEALTYALDVYQHDPPDLGTHILPDLVEAASRAGDRAAATAPLDRFTERALASGTPLALGLLARSRALLADDTAADGLYQEAGDLLARTSAAPQLARTYLLHGEWLRRQRRRRDARQRLGAAADLFETMGMGAFAQRARAELRATGDRVSKRVGGPDNQLTPQESQIAQLVADGLANREIATRLFISPNTVEYHLQKVFRKLGISSRTQLARVLLTGISSPDAA
jgi:DNA-binding CsgD family transcriptional regulator